MARKQKLKVYRTPIGFHDAYVAAPSQKAALEAWGADVNLFARGVAEAVDDEQLAKAPLEKPGTVIRVPRGSNAEHMAALPNDAPSRRKAPEPAEDEGPPPRKSKKSDLKRPAQRVAGKDNGSSKSRSAEPAPAPKSKTRSKPRPSRDRLEEAEQALERAQADHREAIVRIREQEKALQQQRRDLEKRHEDEVLRMNAAIAEARERYSAALEKWRA